MSTVQYKGFMGLLFSPYQATLVVPSQKEFFLSREGRLKVSHVDCLFVTYDYTILKVPCTIIVSGLIENTTYAFYSIGPQYRPS